MTCAAFSSVFMAFSLGALATFFAIHYWWSNERTTHILQAELNLEQNHNQNRIHKQELWEEEVFWTTPHINNETKDIGEVIRKFQ